MIYDTLDPNVADYLKNNKPPAGVRWHRQLTEIWRQGACLEML